MSTLQKSESIKNLMKALFVFNEKVPKIEKKSINPYFRSKYAGLPDILDAIKEPLKESGLVISQPLDEESMTTILCHVDSAEYIISTSKMKPVKEDPQAMGSAITYQRRYAIASILNLNIDDDDDGNAASHVLQSKETKVKKEVKPELLRESPEFLKAVDWVKNNKGRVSEIKKKYYLSKETEDQLTGLAFPDIEDDEVKK